MTDEQQLANEMARLIYKRSQMTEGGDAYHLACDLLNLVKDKLAPTHCEHCGVNAGRAAHCPGQLI